MIPAIYAGMAESVDATDLKSVGRKPVRVQVPLSASKNTVSDINVRDGVLLGSEAISNNTQVVADEQAVQVILETEFIKRWIG